MLARKNIFDQSSFGKSLAKYCWFNAGGDAEIFFAPDSIASLQDKLKMIAGTLDYWVLGNGSNVLVLDGGVQGLTILIKDNISGITKGEEPAILHVKGGTLCATLASAAAKFNIAGLEFNIGIPGTVGGAIAMNAGAYKSETADCLLEIEIVNKQGEYFKIPRSSLNMTYRNGGLEKDYIVVGATYKGIAGDQNLIRAKMEAIKKQRIITQPVQRGTGGSTFKNPAKGLFAWELIEKSGAKFFTQNQVRVSEKHANFLINEGNSADDIKKLGEEIKKTVKEKNNISLEWEIKHIGKELN